MKLSVVFTSQGDERKKLLQEQQLSVHNETVKLQFFSLAPPAASASQRVAHPLLPETLALTHEYLCPCPFQLPLCLYGFQETRVSINCNNSNYIYTPEGNQEKANHSIFTGLNLRSFLFPPHYLQHDVL